jgi:hypothetical protein
MTASAFLYLLLSVLGFSVTLPADDVALVEHAAFVDPGELPAGVCGITITTHWPDGSRPNEDEIKITAGPNATAGCRIDFIPTAIIHELGHVVCNDRYREWQASAPDPHAAAEQCAWWYTWEQMPNQTARIYLPPDIEITPPYGGPQ